MIKEVTVPIRINSRNHKYYEERGFEINLRSINDVAIIEVDVMMVNKNSDTKITAICDICYSENYISIHKYWVNFYRGNYNFYSCFNCKNYKKEMTSNLKFGCRSFSKTDLFKKKFKETCLQRFGVENPNKSSQVREKIRNTNMKRYGKTTQLLSEEVKEKNRIWMRSNEFKAKSEKTLFEKYGETCYSKTEKFRISIKEKKDSIVEKIKNTNLLRFGVDSYFKTDEYKNSMNLENNNRKRIQTCLSKYGVDNVSKVELINDKIQKTKIERGYYVSDELLSGWKSYKKKVRRFTNKNKKKLFESWDGYDYYDNEYIKYNVSMRYTDRMYPTIDHKLSLFYGFTNSIEPETISDINNLCITKRYINCKKNKLSEVEFLEKYK